MKCGAYRRGTKNQPRRIGRGEIAAALRRTCFLPMPDAALDDLSAGNNERLVAAVEAQYVDLVASDIEVRSLLITLAL